MPSARSLSTLWSLLSSVSLCLPFGLSTAPLIFNLFAEGLHWLLEAYLRVGSVFHYLDDFISALPASPSPAEAISDFDLVFDHLTDTLGIPRNPAKDEAGTSIVALGIEIDTLRLEARLPLSKAQRATDAAASTLLQHLVSMKDLERLAGFLTHCAAVVRLGRPRLRALYSDIAAFHSGRTRLRRLSSLTREDLVWWRDTLPLYNGTFFFKEPRPLIALYTDASDVGLGFFFFHTPSFDYAREGRCGNRTLPSSQAAAIPVNPAYTDCHINVKEVAAIHEAFLFAAHLWAHHKVLIFTDSTTAFSGLSNLSLRGPAHIPLLALLSIAAAQDIDISPFWLPSKENSLADALSRLDVIATADLCPHWQDFSTLTRPTGSRPKPLWTQVTLA
jgi:hypothetical protein